MFHKDSPIALILGGGFLTKTLIENCKKKKIKFHIIAIEESFNSNFGTPNLKLNINNIANVFKYLNKNKIYQVIFLGKIYKKKLIDIRPNFLTLYYLIRIFFFYNSGDGKLLNKVIDIFNEKNIKVLDPRPFLKNNLSNKNKNNITRFKNNFSLKKIKKYYLLAKEFGEKDLGQAVIISNNKVLLTEDQNGTDYLISKFKSQNIKTVSWLVKVAKPYQDLRVDLPTIGPTTIRNMLRSGIQGLIVEEGKTFIEDPELTFRLIKKNKIFFYAV